MSLPAWPPPGARAELDLARASGQLDERCANVGGDLASLRSTSAIMARAWPQR
jgi:hypothetical protein